ncbi:hypothetical protein HRG_008417 [Hirsutella rhossiliensis]|uniref:Uncharacterized protein n=1 Tax=Hirsutella rhossiliensis TaxID=111463 RepID=A0A9P8MSI6_9HYPO|nr:uncharacterized protein HRG_08417 [Hirsutella rhossiliensis]KAH0960262.1 hypothetical protein HRG_08417 [Hirsutella rhossiliensis]
MQRPSPPIAVPVDLAFGFELEFLVPQKREGYSSENHSDRGPYTDGLPFQWACPADEHDPKKKILELCTEVMSRRIMGTIIWYRVPDATSSVEWDPLDASFWVLRPSTHAKGQDCCLDVYKWFGLKLRSPLYAEDRHEYWKSETHIGIASLRNSVRMHANSTCPFNVFFEPSCPWLELTDFKKLFTLL